MRLSTSEVESIVASVQKYDPMAKVFLYGSRTDDTKKGGDIDLLVISEKINFETKLKIILSIQALIGEQKIDLKTLSNSQCQADEFYKSIKDKMLCLA